jgi:hypothetical protein
VSAEAIKQFIVGVVIPPIAGALATWLTSTQVFSIFHITQSAAAAEITAVLVFGVVTGLTWLTQHHVLSGHYTPAAKRSPVFTELSATGFGAAKVETSKPKATS